MLKIACVVGGSKNEIVPQRSQPIIAKMDCDVVRCPTVGNKHWLFDPWLANVAIQFVHFSFGGIKDSILTNIDCISLADKYRKAMIFLRNL